MIYDNDNIEICETAQNTFLILVTIRPHAQNIFLWER